MSPTAWPRRPELPGIARLRKDLLRTQFALWVAFELLLVALFLNRG